MAALIVGAVLVTPCVVRSQDEGVAITSCPGYVDHLRNARQYLGRSERASALVELKRARESLRYCEEADADEIALAARASSPHSS